MSNTLNEYKHRTPNSKRRNSCLAIFLSLYSYVFFIPFRLEWDQKQNGYKLKSTTILKVKKLKPTKKSYQELV